MYKTLRDARRDSENGWEPALVVPLLVPAFPTLYVLLRAPGERPIDRLMYKLHKYYRDSGKWHLRVVVSYATRPEPCMTGICADLNVQGLVEQLEKLEG